MTPAGPLPIKTQPGSRSGAAPEEGAGSEGVSAVGNLMLWAREISPETTVSPLGVKSHHVLNFGVTGWKNGRVPTFGGVSSAAA